MYRGSSRQFKVVFYRENQYAIWHAEAPTRPTWKETGRYGSESECWDYIEAHEEKKGVIIRFPDWQF